MALENIILLLYKETHANLISINPVLSNGQEVIVTGITSCINEPRKRGDGSTAYTDLPFVDRLKIETDSTYDLTASFLAVDNNEVQITNIHATNAITITGPSASIVAGSSNTFRRVSGSWISVSGDAQKEHDIDGVHDEGSARIYIQEAEPTGTYVRKGSAWYKPSTGEISYYNTSWETSLGSGTSVEAGENIDAGEQAYIHTDGKAYLADLNYEEKSYVSGTAVASATTGNTVVLQKAGLCKVFSGLTPGQAYFLGETGAIVAGTGSFTQNQYRTYIGVAQAADTIDLNVSAPLTLEYVDAAPIGVMLPYMGAGGSLPAGWEVAEGQTLNRHVYKELDNVCYVGDGNNATAESFYRTSDAGGTTRSTTGDYIVLPDSRGAFVRFTGSHGTETMADGNPYAGPAVGAFEDDQFQGHRHAAPSTGNYIIYNPGTPQFNMPATPDVNAGAASSTGEPNTDGTNGTPRTGDETRPFAIGATAMIKVSRVTPTGEAISALMYDTGWVANSDWTDAELTVNHNLGANLSDLIVKFFLSSDGTEANAFEINNTTIQQSSLRASAEGYGTSIIQVSTNAVKVQTGQYGITYISETGTVSLYDSASVYYKVVVYKPAVLAHVANGAIRSVSADYTIGDMDADIIEVTTGATDRTITLPTLADNIGRKIKIVKVDDGAGKVTIDGEGAETIDGVTTIDIDSQYDMAVIEAGATCWNLEQYKDHGSNSNGSWERFADGTMVQEGTVTVTTSPQTGTYPQEFNSNPLAKAGGTSNGSIIVNCVVTQKPTSATEFTFYVRNVESGTYITSGTWTWESRGRWRA